MGTASKRAEYVYGLSGGRFLVCRYLVCICTKDTRLAYSANALTRGHCSLFSCCNNFCFTGPLQARSSPQELLPSSLKSRLRSSAEPKSLRRKKGPGSVPTGSVPTGSVPVGSVPAGSISPRSVPVTIQIEMAFQIEVAFSDGRGASRLASR